MCGRFIQTNKLEALLERFGARLEPATGPWDPSYNLAPSQSAPVIVTLPDRVLRLMTWGLVPSWAKDPKIGSRMVNARSETLASKPAFKRLLRSRRCLVPAGGFYEWRKDPAAKAKQPFVFRPAKDSLFAFAGLWDEWTDPDGRPRRTFTICTTEANDAVRPVHHRMPVILDRDGEEAWLGGERDPDFWRAILKPCPPGALEAYPVSRSVNSPAHNDPSCLEPLSGGASGEWF